MSTIAKLTVLAVRSQGMKSPLSESSTGIPIPLRWIFFALLYTQTKRRRRKVNDIVLRFSTVLTTARPAPRFEPLFLRMTLHTLTTDTSLVHCDSKANAIQCSFIYECVYGHEETMLLSQNKLVQTTRVCSCVTCRSYDIS